MISGVIFDLDGVVVDGTECDFSAWKQVFSELGLECSYETYKGFLGMKGSEIVKKYSPREMTDKEAELMDDRKEDYFIECARKGGISLTKGVKGLLESLSKEGIVIGLATAAKKRKAEVILEQLEVKGYFNAVVTSDDVSKGKPNPDMFLKAAEKLGLTPEECIVIEDAPNGIQAAKNAGMKCIGITTTHKKEELKEADKVINFFDELTVESLKKL